MRKLRAIAAARIAGWILAGLCVAGCSGPREYRYKYVPGRSATMVGPYAVAPPGAPPAVHAAIEAGNRIVGLPYARGGGHGPQAEAPAYDCSGAVSYLLRSAGQMQGSMPSHGFRRYGRPGQGEWISVYARRGHVFAVVAGLRFDTGYGNGSRGPQWTMRSRPASGYTVRHPAGL